jgi:mRNA interferase MazF
MSRNVKPQKNTIFSYYIQQNGDGNFEVVKPKPKCADIWMADLSNSSESVQCGYRPVFIISNDKNNEFAPTVNVFPLTSKMKRRELPCHVRLDNFYDYGLTAPSTILVEQPLTISQNSLLKFVGRIEDRDTLLRIYFAMQSQFPILQC